MSSAPAAAVGRLSQRLGVPMGELRDYGARSQTRTDHLREIAAYAGWRTTDAAEWKELDEFLFARAMETWARVEHLLSERRRAELDLLLVSDAYLGRTPLAWLGVGPTSSSPAAVKAELEKLAYLRRLDAHTMDLSVLPAERRRFLAGVGRRLTAQALQRREPQRRYPILLTVLAQSAVDVLDETLLLFDQAISGRESAAKAKMTEALAERARGGENRQQLLDEILTIVLDPVVGDEQVGGLIRTRVGMERLPRDHGHLGPSGLITR